MDEGDQCPKANCYGRLSSADPPEDRSICLNFTPYRCDVCEATWVDYPGGPYPKGAHDGRRQKDR